MEGSDSVKLFNHKSKKEIIKELETANEVLQSINIECKLENERLITRVEELEKNLRVLMRPGANKPNIHPSFSVYSNRKLEKLSGYITLNPQRPEPVNILKERVIRGLVEELQNDDFIDFDLVEDKKNGATAYIGTIYVARKL